MKRHTNAIKPVLTEANKYARLNFALDFVKPNMELDDMNEYVHLDEKWFYLTKTCEYFFVWSYRCLKLIHTKMCLKFWVMDIEVFYLSTGSIKDSSSIFLLEV